MQLKTVLKANKKLMARTKLTARANYIVEKQTIGKVG